MKAIQWLVVLPVLVAVPSYAQAQASGDLLKVHEVAEHRPRPPGAPALSDVCFSSRWKHPTNTDDPHDTFETAKAFHVTRYMWVYTSDAGFIREAKKTATSFQCALNSMVPDVPEGGRKHGRIMNLDGDLVSAPWMRDWKDPAWGCCNSPDWRESYLANAKKALDAGADLFQMDDPGLNHTATNWGGCFCDYCVEGFRAYLRDRTSAKERAELGIENLDTFDYREHLREQGAPIGDAFGKWDGGRLKDLFGDFLKESVERFYMDMRKQIDEYAGRHVSFSSNNYRGRWGFPYDSFDFGMAELPHRDVRPAAIYTRLRETRERGKAQVFTLVSEDVAETRRVIATTYACGGHLLVPWDVYLESTPSGSRRYYGHPEDYADLYGFVRENANIFDGYEDAAAIVADFEDERYPNHPPITLQNADGVCALVRAVPGDATAPVVIHLVDWRKTPQHFEIRVDPARFEGGENLTAELLRPKAEPLQLDFATRDEYQTLNIPVLSPWAILKLAYEE